jgi:hypothetical protein
MKLSIFFAWYDFWVGWFYDRKKRVVYICLLPMVVIKVTLKPKWKAINGTGVSPCYEYRNIPRIISSPYVSGNDIFLITPAMEQEINRSMAKALEELHNSLFMENKQ